MSDQPTDDVKLWFKDGTYMDVEKKIAEQFETQPDWDRTESLTTTEEEHDNDSDRI